MVEQGGLGAFRSVDLQKVLAGRTAVVRADIGPTEEGLAAARRKDLETMFQLIICDSPPRAPIRSAFGVMKDQLKVAVANQQVSRRRSSMMP